MNKQIKSGQKAIIAQPGYGPFNGESVKVVSRYIAGGVQEWEKYWVVKRSNGRTMAIKEQHLESI